jgi:hypothetical protein
MESRRKVAEKRCGMLLKALRCVVEENAETAGRINEEERIVKSITEVMTRIDAKEERKVQETLLGETGRWGSRKDRHVGRQVMLPRQFEFEVFRPLYAGSKQLPASCGWGLIWEGGECTKAGYIISCEISCLKKYTSNTGSSARSRSFSTAC